MRLSQGTPEELRQSLDEASIERVAEGMPPGLGQLRLVSELEDPILVQPLTYSLHDLQPAASPP